MKNIYLFIFVCFFPFVLSAQYSAIPDANFEQVLIDQGIDSEGTLDGQVLTSDINTIETLDVAYYFNITDLTGIQDFTSLKYLNCEHNELTVLDVSNILLLEELYCGNPVIDVGPFNLMTTLDVSNNSNLKVLNCKRLDYLTELDVSLNLGLENLNCSFNPISEINLVQNTNLKEINVDYCNLTTLNLTNNTALTHLTVTTDFPLIPWPNTNQILSLDLSQNVALTSVWVEDSVIEELNLKNGTNNILLHVHATQNPNLVCITVDDEVAANAGDYPYSEWSVDAHLFYSENCALGTDSFEYMDIGLYPNPITDILYIEETSETIVKIEILDVLGKRLMSKNKDFTQIDLSNCTSGVYFVKFYVADAVFTKKVVKK